MSESEIAYLLSLPTNSTYDEFTLIGSSCQHIHKPRTTKESYKFVLHLITFISVWFNAFAIYCIFTKTSVSMGRFRWCLLNLQVWSAVFDLTLTILITPRGFMPIIAGETLGILKFSFIIQVYLGFGFFGAMVGSVAVLFIYRHQVIVGTKHFLSFKRRNLVLILVFNYILYINMAVPVLFLHPRDQIAAKIEILKMERCPTKNILDPAIFVMATMDQIPIYIPYVCILIVFVGAECGLLSLHSAWILFFSTLSSNFSKKTRIMQIKFLFALILQIAIPTALCYAPLFYLIITILIDHYWQFANDVCIFVVSTHGSVSSICLVLLYDCYRDYLFYRIRTLCCCCCKSRTPQRARRIEDLTHIRSDNSRNMLSNYIT